MQHYTLLAAVNVTVLLALLAGDWLTLASLAGCVTGLASAVVGLVTLAPVLSFLKLVKILKMMQNC